MHVPWKDGSIIFGNGHNHNTYNDYAPTVEAHVLHAAVTFLGTDGEDLLCIVRQTIMERKEFINRVLSISAVCHNSTFLLTHEQ